MKILLLFILLSLSGTACFGQETDTFRIYFSLNDTRINEEQGQYLDSIISNNLLAAGHKVRLLGYTDYLGKAAHNDSLSTRRARSVEEHLLAAGFNEDDITLCAGEGEIKRAPDKMKDGYTEDRKVLIISDKIYNAQRPHDIIDIKTVKVNEAIPLKNIFFREGLPDVAPVSYPELIQLYWFLKDNKGVTILIEGHICCLAPIQGTDVPFEHSTLSTLRAKSVYDYLVSKGIDKARLQYKGLGNTKPAVSPEETDEDMEQNRRVEIRVLSK